MKNIIKKLLRLFYAFGFLFLTQQDHIFHFLYFLSQNGVIAKVTSSNLYFLCSTTLATLAVV